MEPVIIGDATLYCGDCLEVLPTLSGVDAVVTDPPYGIGYRHGDWRGDLAGPSIRANQRVHGDDKPFNPTPFLNYSKAILWGANNYCRYLPDGGGWLVWDKREGMSSNDQADCEIAWTNTMHTVRIFHHLWNGMLKASERGEQRVHPTQKPIALMLWCLEFVGGAATIFDPYMGSGTVGIACVRSRRRYIGVEIKSDDFDIACNRIEAAWRNRPRLFDDKELEQLTQGELL